ncbi:MAG: GH25 family lysozyme [Eubacteriales bacterium]
MKRPLKILLIVACGLFVLFLTLACLIFFGFLHLNNPSKKDYPVRGVDVSAYQGEIDWSVLGEDLDFAFLKATEGSTHVDRYFESNYEGARACGLRVGAYHFFSFDSPGAEQAANFIGVVESYDDMLPPVVDVELYGDYFDQPPADKRAVVDRLSALLERLEEHYGLTPILYATEESYDLFLSEDFADYDLWIRNVVCRPKISGWVFWQYCNRGRLDGYSGEERYIDLNVFYGTREEFREYGRKKEAK